MKNQFQHMLSKITSAALIVAFTLTSCSKDDSDTQPSGEFVLTGVILGTNFNNSYYTVAFDNVMEGNLTFMGQDLEQLGYFAYNKYNNAIYSTGGLGATNLSSIQKSSTGDLIEKSSSTTFNNSINDLIQADANTLVGIELASSSDVLRLHLIDASTMNVTKTTDTQTSELSDEPAPSYSGMVISGSHLFISYYTMDPSTFATTNTDKAQVAVFSYPELAFIKVIEDSRVGPIGGFNICSGLVKDDQGNVYALSHSNPANGFSQSTKPSGILKINQGETTFDTEYLFDIETLTDGNNTAHMVHLSNGRFLTEVNTASRAEQAAWSDSPLTTAIIDINENTINYIDGLPQHAGIGRKLAATSLIDGQYVYMAVPVAEQLFVYRINTADNTATKGAEIDANFVAGFYKL